MEITGEWRTNRERGWHTDIGYQLQDVLRAHRFEVMQPGSDIGRHACSCGSWEGYWTDFHPHVADHLRAVAVETAIDASLNSFFQGMRVCDKCSDKRCPGAMGQPCIG